jgi:outer membrane receptor protein involved in Fe transport
MQHTVAFQGAGEKSNYYLSYNFLNDNGILESNKLNKHTFTGNASSQLTTKLNVGTNITYVNNASQRSQIGNQLSNPFFRGWMTPRNIDLQGMPVQRPDGSQIFYNANTDNPYWTLRNNLYNDEVNRVFGNVNLSYDILDWLNVNYRIGTDAYTLNIKTVDAIGARGQANHAVGGVGAVGDRHIYNQETSSYLNVRASRKITEDLGATLLVGNEVNIRTNTDNLLVGNTLVTRGYNNMRNATNYVPTYDQFRRRLVGVYADLQLDFRGWAFLGITGRNDWSSTFNPDKRSYFYPSITGSLVLSDMIPAIRGENEILSFAKIRANYAKVGREAPVYGTDTYFSANNPSDGFGPQLVFPFLGLQGRTLANTAGNPELGPEFTASYEIGTDLRFFNNRVAIDLGYFKTISTDIILDVPIAGASGFTNQSRNAGRLESNGIELALDITPVKTDNFSWNIAANWTRIRNNVISLAPGVQNVGLGGFTTAQSRVEAGQPYGVLYANTLLRDEQGRLVVNDNGLPIADTRGVQRVGDPNPDWLAGITNTVRFKGITATFLIDIRQGGDILSRNIGDLRRTGVAVETVSQPRFGEDGLPLRNYVIDGVRQSDGGVNETAITAQQYYANLYSFSFPGMFVFDASWVRLREASIFYSLPQSVIGRTPFGKAEIGLNGRNLLLFTKVPHIDPEVNLTGASNSQGLEFNALPQTRNYGAVLRFTF